MRWKTGCPRPRRRASDPVPHYRVVWSDGSVSFAKQTRFDARFLAESFNTEERDGLKAIGIIRVTRKAKQRFPLEQV
jgi:hypothetical protein